MRSQIINEKPPTITKSLAYLKTNMGQASIDPERGVVSGVKIMQLGKLACFRAANGKVHRVRITPAHIAALMAHAGNRAIPVHLTHEWIDAAGKANADTAEMEARIGALKQFRKDDAGDLVGDLYLKAGKTRDDILWGAEHNPEDNMLSAVFGFAPDDTNCMPVDFRACDIVPNGAATTALFAEAGENDNNKPNKTNMEITEFLTMLDDPKVKDAIQAMVKAHTAATEPEPAKMEQAATAAMRKVVEDTGATGLMAEVDKRVEAKVTEKVTGIETALLTKAEAKVTAALGANPALRDFGKKKEDRPIEVAIAAQLAAGAKNRGIAIMRVANDNPEVYNAARAAGDI